MHLSYRLFHLAPVSALISMAAAVMDSLALSYIALVISYSLLFGICTNFSEKVHWTMKGSLIVLATIPAVGVWRHFVVTSSNQWLFLAALLTATIFLGLTGLPARRSKEKSTRVLGWTLIGACGFFIPAIGLGTAAVGFQTSIVILFVPCAIIVTSVVVSILRVRVMPPNEAEQV